MSQLKTFLVSVSPGDKVARIRAQLLHILYELGKDDHQFRLRYNGQIMRDAFLLSDYDITDNAVVTMIPMGKSKDVCLLFFFFFFLFLWLLIPFLFENTYNINNIYSFFFCIKDITLTIVIVPCCCGLEKSSKVKILWFLYFDGLWNWPSRSTGVVHFSLHTQKGIHITGQVTEDCLSHSRKSSNSESRKLCWKITTYGRKIT